MIADLKPYPAMKDSGVPWLREVPTYWEVVRLRNTSEMRVSNVDKHAKDDEQPVRLCNYVDVYKNDRIRSGMAFMRATATTDEIERFRLQSGDVLITKDSEAWNDIGVPALVEDTQDDIVSGYHLALLRPFPERVDGGYLFRVLQSPAVAYQFHVEANGVTRYGLSHRAIRSVWLPLPPLSEQAAIVRYLDHADRRIRRYIRAKQKLIKLLEEQKQALIHRAVTGQIDVRTGQPYPAYKASGVEWLGEVPAHWEVKRSRLLFKEVNVRSTTGKETHLSMSQTLGLVPSHMVERTLTSESYVGGKLCEKGDLVLNRLKAHLGVFALAKQSGVISPDYSVFGKRSSMEMEYFEQVFLLPALRSELRIRAKGIVEGFWRLYTDDLFDIRLPVPPVGEQKEIVDVLQGAAADIDSAIDHSHRQIELLREYRTRLIADVVTGKLDVREEADRLPDEAEKPVPIEEDEDWSEPVDDDIELPEVLH